MTRLAALILWAGSASHASTGTSELVPALPTEQAQRCTFITVPDPSLWLEDGRYVTCNRTPSQHPVRGEGRFVDHRVLLTETVIATIYVRSGRLVLRRRRA